MKNKTKIYSGVYLSEGFYASSVCPHCDNVFLVFDTHVINLESRFKYIRIQQLFNRVPGRIGCICDDCGEVIDFGCAYKDMEGKDATVVGAFAMLYFKSLSVWWNPWTWRTGYFIRKEDKDQIKKLTQMGSSDAI